MAIRHGRIIDSRPAMRFSEMDTELSYARARWEEGELRLQRFSPDSHRRQVLEDVVEAIISRLQQRIGQTFSTAELIQLQERGEDWCQEVAHEVAPDSPWAWELDVVAGAAFHRFARRATDYQLGGEE